ncbi:MAG: hypothetical protein ED557_06245 [Balneola sp.]|nr:MAG: hypothetical protein ED557_06245 [Balneola sp.]
MSGGGGGGRYYPPRDSNRKNGNNATGSSQGGSTGSSSIDCKQISFQTNVTSPDPDVLSRIVVGNLLSVGLSSENGPIIVSFNAQVLGSITNYRYIDLKRCINEGYSYIAEVINIDGGTCSVRIYSTD